jgi:nitrite reductase/ring-hydroxylating ferredoxin subunit
MEGFTKIGRADDFAERKPTNLSLGGLEVVVVKVDDAIYAFENNCPHQHFSLLHQGFIENCSITCPMHGWTFDLNSGSSTNGNGKLRKFDVKISGGWVWIGSEKSGQKYSLFDAN